VRQPKGTAGPGRAADTCGQAAPGRKNRAARSSGQLLKMGVIPKFG
jgi:hypothetical protein